MKICEVGSLPLVSAARRKDKGIYSPELESFRAILSPLARSFSFSTRLNANANARTGSDETGGGRRGEAQEFV